jgi:hypothetical protein
MKFGKNTSRRSGRKPVRKTLNLFGLEQLEPKLLMANDITIATGGLTSIPAGATTYSNTCNYMIAPSALETAGSTVSLRANDSITFTDPVVGMGESLDAETTGQMAVNADISTDLGDDISLVGSNSLSGMATESGVVFTGSAVSSGGSLMVSGVGYASGATAGVNGVYLDDSTLATVGSGQDLSVTGTISTANYGDDVGVLIGGGSAITTDAGSLTVTGTSAGASSDAGHNYGVFVDGGAISSVTGAVSVTGQGASDSGGDNDYGVLVWASGFIADVPDIDSLGTGGTSTSAVITSMNGPVSVTGTGGGTSGAIAGAGVYVNTGGRSAPATWIA